MRVEIFTLVLFAILLSGCTSMYGTPEKRQLKNAATPDYLLCESLAVATLAPQEIRAEWAMELQRRGVDCGQYAVMLDRAIQRNQALTQSGLQAMQQPSNGAPNSASKRQTTCFKQREWTSGINKNCVYDCLGSEYVQTMDAVSICPVSILR